MDLDVNGTEDEFSQLSLEVAVSSVVVLSIATIVGTLGNVLLLVVIATSKGIRTTETVFVINLAISDLYVTSIADPMGIIAKLHGAEFFERIPGLCQTVASMCTISCVSSLMTIALMSVNRYFYICKHDTYRAIFTYRNVILMCMSLYLIGTFLVLLNLAGIGDHNFDHKSYECIWDRMATFPYTVLFSVTLVWIPTLITGACYLRIYMYVSAHRRKIRQQIADSDFHHHNTRAPTLRKLHLAKTLFTIYAVFATCWIPYALLIVVDSNDDFPHEVHVYITMFAHLHPSLNWMIYYATNKKFSDAYRQLYNRCCGSCFLLRSSTDDVTRANRIGKETRQTTETTTHSHREIVERRMVLEDVVESDVDSNKRQGGTDDAASAI